MIITQELTNNTVNNNEFDKLLYLRFTIVMNQISIHSLKLISFSLSSNVHNIVVNNPISIACVVIFKLWLRFL